MRKDSYVKREILRENGDSVNNNPILIQVGSKTSSINHRSILAVCFDRNSTIMEWVVLNILGVFNS